MSEPATKNKSGAPKVSGWFILVILSSLIAWGYYYLFTLRPLLNQWLAQYITAYPAILHLIPILAIPIMLGIALSFVLQKSKN